MLPVAVGDRFGEEWIARGGHPLGQCPSGIFVIGQLHLGRIQSGSRKCLAGLGVIGRCGGDSGSEFRFVGQGTFATVEGREERGHLVVILLGPFFIRVVVASGALEPLPHEKLSDVLGAGFGVAHLPIPDHCGIGLGVPGSGEKLADQNADRLVFEEALSKPIVEGIRTVAGVLSGSIIPENGRPFRCKVGGIVGRFQEPVDQFDPTKLGRFWGIAAGGDQGAVGIDLLDAWQTASDIQGDPSQIGRIIARTRGGDPKRFELIEYRFVDRTLGERERLGQSSERDTCAENGHLTLVACHDRYLAAEIPDAH